MKDGFREGSERKVGRGIREVRKRGGEREDVGKVFAMGRREG